ncbi:hypothetical protein [Oceanisphaera sp. W20_SRM_FM3]|uniref:hypothetical protein n=1 Tax=Oceanisphaera sp. W20_SRM_FM3 TaxID=3240267 RepID=UPI003F993B76
MKTTSVALFLALSAGYLGVANAASLTNNMPRAVDTPLACEHDTESQKNSVAAVNKKQR